MLLNRSITTQFTIVFIVALLLIVGSFYLVLESVYHSQLKAQAETVADNVDAFGSWVSQYGRVWVRDNDKSYLGQVTLVNAGPCAGRTGGRCRPAGALAFLLEEPGAGAARVFGSRREVGIAGEISRDLAQFHEPGQQTGRIRGQGARPTTTSCPGSSGLTHCIARAR
jgi:hypothetical protein